MADEQKPEDRDTRIPEATQGEGFVLNDDGFHLDVKVPADVAKAADGHRSGPLAALNDWFDTAHPDRAGKYRFLSIEAESRFPLEGWHLATFELLGAKP